MKVFVILALLALAQASPAVIRYNEEAVSDEMIHHINSVQSLWVASKQWVKSMTLGEAQGLTSVLPDETPFPEYHWGTLLDHFTAPDSFDSRVQWPGAVHPIRDQGACGSCWAFGATEVLSDRLYIASKGTVDVVLSPQYLVNCNGFPNQGCNGGILLFAWSFLKSNGVPADNCVPYTALDQTCSSTCADGSSVKSQVYKAASASSFKTPAAIQAEILTNGPIEVQFTVYRDFLSYTSGIYVHTTGEELGGHAVKAIGWGVSGTIQYWICANSWSTTWGENGFFNIAFGQCGIDSAGIAGLPVL